MSHFAKFTTWQASRFAGPRASLVFCTLGGGSEAAALHAIAEGRTIDGRTLQVRQIEGNDDISACHVIFVAEVGGASVVDVLDRADGQGILTIAERGRFAPRDEVVEFWVERNQESGRTGIRFAVNLDAAEQAGLRVSSKVLKHAHSTESGGHVSLRGER